MQPVKAEEKAAKKTRQQGMQSTSAAGSSTDMALADTPEPPTHQPTEQPTQQPTQPRAATVPTPFLVAAQLAALRQQAQAELHAPRHIGSIHILAKNYGQFT